MDKKVTVKNIDKIMKYNKYENSVVTYKCGDEEIEIEVVPFGGMEHWLIAIATGVSLIDDDDLSNKYVLGVKSIALKLAVLINFTKMNNKLSNAKLIEFIQNTDIIYRIRDVIPGSVYDEFVSDFNCVADYITDKHNNNVKDAFYSNAVDALNNAREFVGMLNDIPTDEIFDKLTSLGEDGDSEENGQEH